MLHSKNGTFLAAMSATNLGSLKLPPEPATLIIAADDDQTGKLKRSSLVSGLLALGWRASTLLPPHPVTGTITSSGVIDMPTTFI